MKNDSQNHPTKDDAEHKNQSANPSDAGGVETKRRKRKLIACSVLATVFAVLCVFFVSFHKHFNIPAITCLWCFFAMVGIGLIVEFKRYQGKHHFADWFGGVIIVLGSVLCIYLIHWHIKPLPAEAFSVSLDLLPLDPKDPFGTKLILENQSQQPIKDVKDIAFWNDSTGPAKRIIFGIIDIIMIPELKPHTKQTISINPLPGKTNFRNFGPKTFIEIEITYRPKSWLHDKTDRFQFCVIRDEAGRFVWLPAGEGLSIQEVEAKVNQQPLRPIDIVPFLNVRVTAVENISQTNKDYPLQISYSWQNIGGDPATQIYIEWAVWDTQRWFIRRWTNQWSIELLNAKLLPGMTNRMATVYRDKTSPAIFDGIMSGNLTLLGMVQFKDLENHDYGMHVRAIRTNNEFEVRYLDLTGYFKEIEKFSKSPK